MSATYEWINLHTLPALYGEPRQIEWYGTLTFDQNAGHVRSSDLRSGYPEAMPYFGMRWSMAGELSGGPQRCADIHHGIPELIDPDCSLLGDLVITQGPRLLVGANVDLGPQYLTGALVFGNTSSDFAAHSVDSKVWAVDRLTSDDSQWYCVNYSCEGMTGLWQRDWTVPEPSMISFVLVALVIVYRLRRFL